MLKADRVTVNRYVSKVHESCIDTKSSTTDWKTSRAEKDIRWQSLSPSNVLVLDL
jgi:hypothetical protein